MGKDLDKSGKKSTSNDVDAFLSKVAAIPPARSTGGSGRLLFAMDATASRQPTWDHASHLQREMFDAAAEAGQLELQIAYFRGFGEFRATPWTKNSKSLIKPLSRVNCLGGHTQIRKVLNHTLKQTRQKKVNALVYVGDCMEEDADQLCHIAGELGMQGVPVFIFQEGYEPTAQNCFQQIAHLTNGAFCRFDVGSADVLKKLLKAVALYATGGRQALEDYSRKTGGETLLLTQQIK